MRPGSHRVLSCRLAVLVAAAGCAAVAAADPPFRLRSVVVQGQAVPGVGLVTTIDNLAVNSQGHWIVESDTDAVAGTDQVLIKNGALFLREGQALSAPSGFTISSFDSMTLNDLGTSGWNFFLAPTGPNDSGLFRDGTLLLQEGFISLSPVFTPPTPYIGFFETKWNNASQMLITASIDDPAIATTVDRAMVVIDGSGGPLNERVLAKEGDVLPGNPDPVADFSTGPHEIALGLTHALFVNDSTGATTADTSLHVAPISGAGPVVMLLREGDPTLVAGRTVGNLTGRGLDLNDAGAWVMKVPLDTSNPADNELIVKSGAVFMREGSGVPDIAPFTFETFGLAAAPVDIDSAGGVTFIGDFNDPDTTRDVGIFRNARLLVREGVTQVLTPTGMRTIRALATGQDAFAVSTSGRYIIFECTLEPTGSQAAVLLTFCPVDLNNDGEIDFSDIEMFIALYTALDPLADFNDDTEIDFSDIEAFIAQYAAGC